MITTQTMALSNVHGKTDFISVTENSSWQSSSPDYSDTLTVLVGRRKQKFVCHKDKLSARSKFFKAACSKKWKEGKQEVLRLPEIKPDTFQLYTDWAYNNVVPPADPSTRPLIELYLIGDFLDDVRLRNTTMELLVESVKTHNTFPRADSIKLICDHTTANSPIRAWILDVAAKYYDRASFAEHAVIFPADFVLQVALRLLPEHLVDVDPLFLASASKYLKVEEVDWEGGFDMLLNDGSVHLHAEMIQYERHEKWRQETGHIYLLGSKSLDLTPW
jgi:hypothetical protein